MIRRSAVAIALLLEGIALGASKDNPDPHFLEALQAVRAAPADLAVRPDRWTTRFSLPSVEDLLKDPVHFLDQTSAQQRALTAAGSSSGGLRAAAQWLGIPLNEPALSPPTSDPVSDLLAAIRRAQGLLDRAVDSVPAPDRSKILEAWKAVLQNNEENADLDYAAGAAATFDQTALLQAADLLTQAVDRALPALKKRSGPPVSHGGLSIRYARRSHYREPVAAAGEKQIRIVIDFGEDVAIEQETAPTAGSGIFGIGLLYLPNARATTLVRTGDFSQGVGLFGVGGFFAEASSATLTCHRAGQGAAAFGVGLFTSRVKEKAVYAARFGAQGAGFSRGFGLFAHQGDNASITGGLYYPDPREELAFISLCQGVGYGPRTWAAGGVGLALVEGNRNRVESSYFAQGAGYWLGYGGFFLVGDENHLQARRYDQGSGIHTAVGTMQVQGHKNDLVNWGVGPAYGWDYGVGLFSLKGDENHLGADWGAGHGDINGRGLARVEGDRNILALPDFGTGASSRNAPSYGIVAVTGQANEILRSSSLWGALKASVGTLWKDHIDRPKPEWPPVKSRGETQDDEKRQLAEKMARAQQKPGAERLGDWLSIAAHFGLDSEIPGQAREKLWTLAPADVPFLIDRVSPDRFDEFVALRAIAAAYASQTGPALQGAFRSATGMRKLLLLGLMSASRPDEMAPDVEAALKDPDWRIRRGALGVLGYWFDRERGRTPGRLYLMTADDKDLRRQQGEKVLGDLFAILSLNPALGAADRLAIANAQPDLAGNLTSQSWGIFADHLKNESELYQKLFRQQMDSAAEIKTRLHPRILEALQDAEPEVVQAALITLGQWGDGGDAAVLRSFLDGDKAYWREGAATALAKLGPQGRSMLEALYRSADSAQRILAIVSASQSWDPTAKAFVQAALNDPDERVKEAARAAIRLF